jgi:hypothetical protein
MVSEDSYTFNDVPPAPSCYFAQTVYTVNKSSCTPIDPLDIYLDYDDYILFINNSNEFDGIGGTPGSCDAIARNISGNPLVTGFILDNSLVVWEIKNGGQFYYEDSC